MKTDTIFYRLFQAFPAAFFEQAVSRLLKLNLSLKQIAEALALEVEQVRQVVQK